MWVFKDVDLQGGQQHIIFSLDADNGDTNETSLTRISTHARLWEPLLQRSTYKDGIYGSLELPGALLQFVANTIEDLPRWHL